jgi:hypothetical protein
MSAAASVFGLQNDEWRLKDVSKDGSSIFSALVHQFGTLMSRMNVDELCL